MPSPLTPTPAVPVDGTAPPAGGGDVDSGAAPPWSFWLYWSHLFTLFGLAVSNLLLGASLVASGFVGRLQPLTRRPLQPVLTALGVHVLLLLAAIATSVDPRTSLRSASEIFTLCTLILALVLVEGETRVRQVIDAIILLATIQSLIGLAQYLVAGGPDLDQRIHGSLSHYMTFSGVLLVAELLLLAEISAGPRRAGWRWLALVPINVALFGSLTRSAWVGLGAGILVLLLLGRRRLLLGLGGTALVVGLLLLPQQPVLERVTSIVDLSNPTNYDRLCMASAGWRMIQEKPLLGQGPGMVRSRYPIYRHPTAPRTRVPHLHSSYLQIAAERGLPALAALLALLALGARESFRRFRREGWRDGPRADLYLAVLAALAGFAVAGFFEDNWNDTEVQRLILFLLAVPFCLNGDEAVDTDG